MQQEKREIQELIQAFSVKGIKNGRNVVLRTLSTTDFEFASSNHSNKGFCWHVKGY